MDYGKQISTADLKTPIAIHGKIMSGTGGFRTAAFSEILTARCKWVNAHGAEAVVSDSNQARHAATVTMRYHPDINESCRVILLATGETFEIATGIDNIREAGRWIEFKVRSVISG